MRIAFAKMHGLGNDFAVVDGVRQPLPAVLTTAEMIAKLACRRTGIGFDQLLILQPSTIANVDFVYRIFNADGGEVGQCGNGARCVHTFLRQQGISEKTKIILQTATTRIQTAAFNDGSVRAYLQSPVFGGSQTVDGIAFELVDMGNPHAVCLSGLVEDEILCRLAEKITEITPSGINVGIGGITKEGIELRVVERGSGLTAACGSGALAAACVAMRESLSGNPVRVLMPGGEILCGLADDGRAWLQGEVAYVFDGVLA